MSNNNRVSFIIPAYHEEKYIGLCLESINRNEEFYLIQGRVVTENLITGSHPHVPVKASILEKYWFEGFRKQPKISHLGSAHMIMSKKTFEKVGGFNEALESGEDYDFCVRAEENDIELLNNPKLRVIHHGFPKKLGDFIRRESWHGKGDLQSLKNFFTLKVLLLTLVFLFLHIASITLFVCGAFTYLSLTLLAIILLLLISSTFKFRNSDLSAKLVNALIFYFYFLGRSLAIVRVLANK